MSAHQRERRHDGAGRGIAHAELAGEQRDDGSDDPEAQCGERHGREHPDRRRQVPEQSPGDRGAVDRVARRSRDGHSTAMTASASVSATGAAPRSVSSGMKKATTNATVTIGNAVMKTSCSDRTQASTTTAFVSAGSAWMAWTLLAICDSSAVGGRPPTLTRRGSVRAGW